MTAADVYLLQYFKVALSHVGANTCIRLLPPSTTQITSDGSAIKPVGLRNCMDCVNFPLPTPSDPHFVTNEYCWFSCARTVPRGNNKPIYIVKEIITASFEVPTRTELRFIVTSRLNSFYISK